MSTRRFPVLGENQQILDLETNRMGAAIEDETAHLARHVLVDAANDADANVGLVLWGLTSTDVSDANGPKVRVAIGAALAPANAGEKAWRLVPVDAPLTVGLTPPEAGTRHDTIEVALEDVLEVQEQRYHRTVAPGGGMAAVQQATNTMRRPAGALYVRQGVDPGAEGGPAVTPGRVRVASVAVASDGTITITDRRSFYLPAISGEGASEGLYLRGLRSAWGHIKTALSNGLASVRSLVQTTALDFLSGQFGQEGGSSGGAIVAFGTVSLTEHPDGTKTYSVNSVNSRGIINEGVDELGRFKFNVQPPKAGSYLVRSIIVTKLPTNPARLNDPGSSTAPRMDGPVFVNNVSDGGDGYYLVEMWAPKASGGAPVFGSFYIAVFGALIRGDGDFGPLQVDDLP